MEIFHGVTKIEYNHRKQGHSVLEWKPDTKSKLMHYSDHRQIIDEHLKYLKTIIKRHSGGFYLSGSEEQVQKAFEILNAES